MPIEPPTDADRDRLAADLRERAEMVLRDGWTDYENTWSTGQVLGVRAVLGEPGAEDAAVAVWAPTLWGLAKAEADAARDYQRTRGWFATVTQAEPVEMTETERIRWDAAATAMRDALIDPDPAGRAAAGAAADQALSRMNLDEMRDRVHVPDDAGEYRDALVRIMRRIPDGWGRWIGCDRGWYPILVALDEQLAEIDPGYELHQSKEKYGTLRYYFHASESASDADRERMHELVDAAEDRTETTCERCGGAGELMTTPSSWLKTLCPPCTAVMDRGYRPVHEKVLALTPDLPGVWQVTATGGTYQIWDLQRGELHWNSGEDRGRIITVLAWPQVGDQSLVVAERDGVEAELLSGEIGEIKRVR